MLRIARVILACVVAAVGVVAAPAMAQPLRKATMGLAGQSMIASIPRFAKEMGLFEKRGIDVSFVSLDSANASATALIAGSVDFAFSGPVELVTARARGREVVAIVNDYGGLGGTLVLSKAVTDKLGVSPRAPVAERLKALKGLTIASPSATSAYTVSFKSAAAAAGVDVKFTYMAIPAMQAAMESGAVQGFVASAPFWALPVVGGTGVLWVSGPKGELPPEMMPRTNSVLLTMRDTIKTQPDQVRNLAAVFADFIEAIDKRPAEVKAAVVKVFPNVDSRTLDLLFESEAQAWKARPLTAADIAHEIAYIKLSGTALPGIEGVDPASMIWP
jgi:ABC-type nitrate/sulfonate/bicarbonate transport system substrate-binding protein